MVADIEHTTALRREAEVSGVEGVVVWYGGLVSHPEDQEVKLLYPHPHEYFS